MKIEKINDNQIKLILTQTDLTERNIKLEDLTSPSEKTQDLFREMMEQAFTECDFISENTPLMVEAMPVGMDGIMIIITKIENKDSQPNNFNLISQSKEFRRFKKKPMTSYEPDCDGHGDLLIYAFATLDDVIDLSVRISEVYHGSSAVYKNNDKYFLILHNDQASDDLKTENLDLILGEYGQKHISTLLAKYYLMEHGEPIVENKAVKVLSRAFADK